MSYKLKVKVTKEILHKAKMCGLDEEHDNLNQNCALAVAIREIFPTAMVSSDYFYPFGNIARGVTLSPQVTEFIDNFDLPVTQLQGENLLNYPKPPEIIEAGIKHRLAIPETEFEINIPDWVIDQLNINDITEVLKGVDHLELIHS